MPGLISRHLASLRTEVQWIQLGIIALEAASNVVWSNSWESARVSQHPFPP